MRTITNSVDSYQMSAPTQAYSPSVPLSVYRELGTELQAAQAKIDALATQNQQLVQENQMLRQEIAKAVKSVLSLQNLVEKSTQEETNVKTTVRSVDTSVATSQASRQATATPVKKRMSYTNAVIPSFIPVDQPLADEAVLVTEQEVRYHPSQENEPEEINGWWLTLIIFLTVLMGFGAGYLVIRPFFGGSSR
ncbi:hypothetical protein [Calothrix sp. 336/3]|uniref:hypothetical protein n=1 Tax=Calothrix sp. 336/3 TaxID=1337936 RepID=UPI0004E4120B|nr:hypothetical protein [Calothrix sp. 336/3]AKG22693.1 hypothetical protein IJ00_16695 [Calothrix sp. 336/3]